MTEVFKSRRNLNLSDESVDAFIRRRLGQHVADTLISAMIHGIYAGNSKELSMRAIFPSLWRMERSWGSITTGMLLSSYTDETKASKEAVDKLQASVKQETRNKLRDASVWSLQGGFQRLADRLVERLRAAPNIQLVSNARTNSIDASSPTQVKVRSPNNVILDVSFQVLICLPFLAAGLFDQVEGRESTGDYFFPLITAVMMVTNLLFYSTTNFQLHIWCALYRRQHCSNFYRHCRTSPLRLLLMSGSSI